MVWAGSKEELLGFLDILEQNTYNLKFTYNFDLERITFLDVEIFIGEAGVLCPTLYRNTENPRPATQCCMLAVHTQNHC